AWSRTVCLAVAMIEVPHCGSHTATWSVLVAAAGGGVAAGGGGVVAGAGAVLEVAGAVAAGAAGAPGATALDADPDAPPDPAQPARAATTRTGARRRQRASMRGSLSLPRVSSHGAGKSGREEHIFRKALRTNVARQRRRSRRATQARPVPPDE